MILWQHSQKTTQSQVHSTSREVDEVDPRLFDGREMPIVANAEPQVRLVLEEKPKPVRMTHSHTDPEMLTGPQLLEEETETA